MGSSAVDAFRLFLIIFSYPELRSLVVRTPKAPKFLAKMAATGDSDVLMGIAVILRRCGMDHELLTALADATFFHRYYDSLKNCPDSPVRLAALAMLDQLSRAGYVKEFSLYIPILQSILALKNEVSGSAIALLVTFSYHQELARKLKESQLVPYFKTLLKVDGLKQLAQLFLDNVSRV
jgi:hypothetical protein